MIGTLGQLSINEFLTQYWQKKPCLLKQAFPSLDFMPDGNDLAGLACEGGVESRLVSGSVARQDWQVRFGPMSEDDFQQLPEMDWTLLVQDVEKHFPQLLSLISAFCPAGVLTTS